MDRDEARFRAVKLWLWSFSVVGGLVLSLGVPPRALGQSQAEIDERCQRRVQHAEHELHEAVERHGRNSREADHERHELHEAREQCWREHHRWWDEHEQRWHDQRDWDDRDHDRD